jgi:hypothetical protein
VRAGAALWGLLREARVPWRRLAAGVALAAVGTVIEAVLFRALFGAAGPALFALIIALLASLMLLELPVAWGLRRAGAAIEERFRDLFMRKIPRLGDRYFQSRPVSDMAERAHLVHKLRSLPTLAGDILRTVLTIVIVTAALVWLDPRTAPLAVALAAAMLLIPLAAQPAVAERDLRMRNHAGALGRYYLDALQGLVAVRTHGAEPALAREHEDRLREWVRAARAALRAALGAEAVQALVGFGLATWLLADHFARTGAHDAGAGLLAVYWALSLPMLGYELAMYVQQVPAQRSLTLRVVEPLGAPEERDDGDPALTRSARPRWRPATPCRSTCRRCGWSRRGTRSSTSPRWRSARGSTSRSWARRARESPAWWGCCWAGTGPRRGRSASTAARSASGSSRRCGSGRCGSIRRCICGTDRWRRTLASVWRRRSRISRLRSAKPISRT